MRLIYSYVPKRKHFPYNGIEVTTLTVLVQNGNVSGKEIGIKSHTVQTACYPALQLMASSKPMYLPDAYTNYNTTELTHLAILSSRAYSITISKANPCIFLMLTPTTTAHNSHIL